MTELLRKDGKRRNKRETIITRGAVRNNLLIARARLC